MSKQQINDLQKFIGILGEKQILLYLCGTGTAPTGMSVHELCT
jgi:hypothetical protein